MVGYTIKHKHMATMSPFLASKNFELRTSLPDSPPKEKNLTSARQVPEPKNRKASAPPEKNSPEKDSKEDERPSELVVTENVELDTDELARQMQSSWA